MNIGAVQFVLLSLCGTLLMAVLFMLCWSVVAHRRAAGHGAQHFHRHLGVELAWTLTPVAIVLALFGNVVNAMLS